MESGGIANQDLSNIPSESLPLVAPRCAILNALHQARRPYASVHDLLFTPGRFIEVRQ